MNVTNFDSTKNFLQQMLKDTSTGDMQLPDFQRGWVWDDEHIKSLIASISQSFPIGAVMTLENGGEDVRFKPRPIEGTDPSLSNEDPATLILDGQQRLTSLFQSLMTEQPVKTWDAKGKKVRRWYYLDMKKCLEKDADREEAVVSVPEDKLLKTFRGEVTHDLSSPENEYKNDMFPLRVIFNSREWEREYNKYWQHDADKWNLCSDFYDKVIKCFTNYQIPVIKLDKNTPKEAVCLVFEKVNTGGVSLTVFELLTASFAADNFQLREDWSTHEEHLKNRYPVLHDVQSDHFLQALTLLATKERSSGVMISCKRRDILRLTLEEYKDWADRVQEGFIKAARFLHELKIFKAKDLPYRPQVVSMAAILAALGSEADTAGARQKIARWYWCGVFGEMYSSSTDTLLARDLPEVTAWVRGNTDEPTTIRDANFQPNRLRTLKTRNSAAYKGVHALLMREGSRDFLTGSPINEQIFFDDTIDIHHIFPQAWCKKQEIESDIFNIIINKTALSASTNRSIGGQAPSSYLEKLQQDADINTAQMDEILESHRIPAQALRADDFGKFFKIRGEKLLQAIESAMGQDVPREKGLFSLGMSVENYNDGPRDWEER